jgi:hypothetical protein
MKVLVNKKDGSVIDTEISDLTINQLKVEEMEKCLLDSDEDVPEKIEMKPVKEKKEIKKPVRRKK